MGKIVVIGGGHITLNETLSLDKHIVKLTKKKHPKALFIPTASGDAEGYWQVFQEVYGKKLGCKTDVLYCLKSRPKKKDLTKKILSADLIYVGGGNTLMMMRRWRLLGIDKLLKQAHKKGVVLSGLSAGGICWFESGHSDSMSAYNPKSWNYIKVNGLGLLKGIHCPHFDSSTLRVKRKNDFSKFMKKYSDMGIAVDEHCAIEFNGDNYKILTSKRGKKAYKVYKKGKKSVIEEIHKKKEYMPIKEMYKKF